MKITVKCGTAEEEDIIEVLNAISVVSKRLAQNIATVNRENQSKEGGKQYEQNQDAFGCCRRCQCCSR